MNMTEKRQVVKTMELIFKKKADTYAKERSVKWSQTVKDTKAAQVAMWSALDKKARKAAAALASVYDEIKATTTVTPTNSVYYSTQFTAEVLFNGLAGVGPSTETQVAYSKATNEAIDRARDLLDQETLRIWTEGDPQMTAFVDQLEAILGA